MTTAAETIITWICLLAYSKTQKKRHVPASSILFPQNIIAEENIAVFMTKKNRSRKNQSCNIASKKGLGKENLQIQHQLVDHHSCCMIHLFSGKKSFVEFLKISGI